MENGGVTIGGLITLIFTSVEVVRIVDKLQSKHKNLKRFEFREFQKKSSIKAFFRRKTFLEEIQKFKNQKNKVVQGKIMRQIEWPSIKTTISLIEQLERNISFLDQI